MALILILSFSLYLDTSSTNLSKLVISTPFMLLIVSPAFKFVLLFSNTYATLTSIFSTLYSMLASLNAAIIASKLVCFK